MQTFNDALDVIHSYVVQYGIHNVPLADVDVDRRMALVLEARGYVKLERLSTGWFVKVLD